MRRRAQASRPLALAQVVSDSVSACSLEPVAHLDEERLGARLLVRCGLAHEAEGDPAVGGELGEVEVAELLLEEAVLRKLAPGKRHVPVAHLHRLEVLADGRLARDRLPVELELGRGGELLKGCGTQHDVAGALQLARRDGLGEALVEERGLGLLQGRLVGVRIRLGLALLGVLVALAALEVQLAHHLVALGRRLGGGSGRLRGGSRCGLRGRLDGRLRGRNRGLHGRSGSRRLLDRLVVRVRVARDRLALRRLHHRGRCRGSGVGRGHTRAEGRPLLRRRGSGDRRRLGGRRLGGRGRCGLSDGGWLRCSGRLRCGRLLSLRRLLVATALPGGNGSPAVVTGVSSRSNIHRVALRGHTSFHRSRKD